ncbi:NAD(P)-dependent oxidoreductase [Pseudoflavitalea sp. G-6-1-2]|nr:NAD(P)-dependent oxidoreductase [Pseudoflavitalea sp. G-6-1-2]
MKQVAVIGLGAMGVVLAKLLIQNKLNVSVWNRTPGKLNQPGLEGAKATTNINEALREASIVIICVKDYEATYELLNGVSLEGKTIIQLSTGTPKDAKTMSAAFIDRGASYIDGAILATPSQMGRPDTPIFLSGNAEAFSKSEDILKVLGGGLLYMGDSAGAASAWDLAVLTNMFGMMTGFLHGARMMEAEGLKPSDLGNMIVNIAPVLAQMIQDTGNDIDAGRFEDPQSSIDICAQSFELMVRQAREANSDASMPTFLLEFFDKGRKAGLGQNRISSLIKVLRNN